MSSAPHKRVALNIIMDAELKTALELRAQDEKLSVSAMARNILASRMRELGVMPAKRRPAEASAESVAAMDKESKA